MKASWKLIFLEKRKNDQYREGHWIIIAAIPYSEACPVRLTKMLMSRAVLAGHRPLLSAWTQNEGYKRKPIAYTTLINLEEIYAETL